MIKRGSNPETVISGSFKEKYLEHIGQIREHFERVGITVRAPKSALARDSEAAFVVLLTDDPSQARVEHEKNFLRDIRNASFHYIADLDGRVGQSVATEMAYARLKGIPVIAEEEIKEFADEVPEEVKSLLLETVREVLPFESMTAENIGEIHERLEQVELPNLEPSQVAVLRKMIKSLLGTLRQPHNSQEGNE